MTGPDRFPTAGNDPVGKETVSGDLKTVQDLTEAAVKVYEMPEFQRESIEWNSSMAATLLDSLYHNMDVGQVSVWKTTGSVYIRRPNDPGACCEPGAHLIMDGGHRTSVLTYLCQDTLPRWCDQASAPTMAAINEIRNRTAYDLIDDRFLSVGARLAAAPGNRWIRATELFGDLGVVGVTNPGRRDDERRRVLADRVAQAYCSEGLTPEPHRLNNAWETRQRILNRQLYVSVAELSLGRALENFCRLNAEGVTLSPDQLLAGMLAVVFQGFRAEYLNPATTTYTRRGLGGGPNGSPKKAQAALVRTFVTELLHQQGHRLVARMGDVEQEDLQNGDWRQAWSKTTAAWDKVLAYLESHGISTDQTTSLNALAPLVLFALKYPNEGFGADDDRLLALYLYNIASERYTKQSTDAYEMDAPTILNSTDFLTAYRAMVKEINRSREVKFNDTVREFTGDDLLRYRTTRLRGSDPMSLYYSVWAHRRGATDWSTGEPVRVKRKARHGLLATQNHHVWPIHLVNQHGIDHKDEENLWLDSVAAIAVLRDTTNNALSDKMPHAGLAELGVDKKILDGRLAAQLWQEAAQLSRDNAREIIERRAHKMAPEISWFIPRVKTV